jgi:ribosomal protein S5
MKKIIFIFCLFSAILFIPLAVTAVGNISVSSLPTGAAVLLDGITTGTTTPTVIENVSGGSHIVLLRFTGYQDYTGSVTVSDNATSTVSATLTASTLSPNSISVFSNPTGAKVYINNNLRGQTPLTLGSVPNGNYQVVIQYTGYSDWSQNITVNNNAQTVNATLTAISATNGSIVLESDPSDAAVYLNTEFKGKTPITINISRGTYRVVIQKTGYQDWSNRISVTAGARTDVYAQLSAEITETTIVTTIPRTTVMKTTITKKTTEHPMTPWPTDTPKESPVEIMVILGAIGIGFIVLRKI